ncbi:MAG: hypothetical protein QOI66_1740 [Myxococcales bacterium]|jgi:hypothetical protein|nr:hypothetical protein [Myxococcales bacterium]
MTDYRKALDTLRGGGVRFIVIGGVAATAHGSTQLTNDLDVVYARDAEDFRRLAAALAPHNPYLRGVPAGLPFKFDVTTIKMGLNFTLDTDFGPLDLLGEASGGGTYDALSPHTVTLNLFGGDCLCVDLPTLIKLKRAAGRPKDILALGELEALLRMQER